MYKNSFFLKLKFPKQKSALAHNLLSLLIESAHLKQIK